MTRPDGAAADAAAVLADASVTYACKAVMRDRLDRDPFDAAARDAERLALVFGRRCERLSGRAA